MSALKFRLFVALVTLAILSKQAESADTKVLILGAGASGLNAAQTLHYKGENDFIILEADDYYGGRVRYKRILNKLVEVGANWIRPVGSKLEDLAQAIELTTKPANFDNIVALTDKGQVVTDEFEDALNRFDEKLKDVVNFGGDFIDDEEPDMSLRTPLKSIGWKPKTPEEKLAEWFRIDFDLADEPERASLIAYAADQLHVEEEEPVVEDNYENNNNNQLEEYRERTDLVLVADNDPYNYRDRSRYDDRYDNDNWNSWNDWNGDRNRRRRRQTITEKQEQFVIDKDGYRSILNETMSFLQKEDHKDQIHFNKVVKTIDYSESDVVVYCTDGTRYTAEYVLVTFSLGVLQSNQIEFVPPLPNWKTDYWNRFEMAGYSKIFLNYDGEKFWDNAQYDKEWIAHVHSSRKGQWPLFLNFAHGDLYGQQTHLLMAILTGDEAWRVESLSADEIKEEAKLNLNTMFTRYDVPRAKSILVSNWTRNPYTLGAYAFWSLGTERDCFGKMESRVDRIFFAGEGTSLNNTGNLQGALESGKREGLKLFNCLYGGPCERWNTKTKCGCNSKASSIKFMAFYSVLLVSVIINKLFSS